MFWTISHAAVSIERQVEVLRASFPELRAATVVEAQQPPPLGAAGWFVIPRWQKLSLTYGGAVRKVLDALDAQRQFSNSQALPIDQAHLRQSDHSAAAFQQLTDMQQGHELLLVAGGLEENSHDNVTQARSGRMPHQLDLGLFAAAILLLTHPRLLAVADDPSLVCLGDEFVESAQDSVAGAPVFSCQDDWDVGDGDHDWLHLSAVHAMGGEEYVYFRGYLPTHQ